MSHQPHASPSTTLTPITASHSPAQKLNPALEANAPQGKLSASGAASTTELSSVRSPWSTKSNDLKPRTDWTLYPTVSSPTAQTEADFDLL